MLSIQHAMCSALYYRNDKSEEFTERLGYVLLPDAVRAYSGPRPYSHFERSSDGKDVSYWAFPTDVKGYTKEFIQADIKEYAHLAEIKPCAIGEDTDINAFYARNKHLPETMFTGIEMHLKQDIVFDKFIRDEIDCSNKYSDVFIFHGEEMDGKTVRSLIGDIEQYGIYVLAHKINNETGMKITNEWINETVAPVLYRDYPEDLADKTLGFMHIRDDINAYIKNDDCTHMEEGPVPRTDYEQLYNDVMAYMNGDTPECLYDSSEYDEPDDDLEL